MTLTRPNATDRATAGSIVDEANLGLPDLLPPPSAPLAVARQLLDERTVGGLRTLRNWRGGWRQHVVMHWPEVEQAEVNAWLYKRLGQAKYKVPATARKPEEHKPWSPTRSKVADVSHALQALQALQRWYPRRSTRRHG